MRYNTKIKFVLAFCLIIGLSPFIIGENFLEIEYANPIIQLLTGLYCLAHLAFMVWIADKATGKLEAEEKEYWKKKREEKEHRKKWEEENDE